MKSFEQYTKEFVAGVRESAFDTTCTQCCDGGKMDDEHIASVFCGAISAAFLSTERARLAGKLFGEAVAWE